MLKTEADRPPFPAVAETVPPLVAEGGPLLPRAAAGFPEAVPAAGEPLPGWAGEAARRFGRALDEEEAQGRGFLFVPVLVGLGAVLWFSATKTPPLAAILAIFLVATPLWFFNRYRSRPYRYPAAAAALVAAGMLLAALETARMDTVIVDSGVTVTLTGEVVKREAVAGGGWRYTIRVASTAEPELKRPPGQVALLARSRHEALAPGEAITGRARLSPPSGAALPGLSGFSFSAYFQGTGAIGFFYGPPRKAEGRDLAPPGIGDRVSAFIETLRGAIGLRVQTVLPGDAGAFATAMVTDERRAISRQTTEALRLSGLAHIIAISGLNMALAAGIFFVGLRALMSLHQGFAQGFPVKKLAAAGALVAVTAYYLLSGSAVSAERAWLMMSIMLVAVLFGRPSISLRNVALSALVILVISPSDVMGASFQMSFAATVALVAGYALYKERPAPRDRRTLPGMKAAGTVWRFFAGIALTSIIGGASTAIFSIEHFQQLAVWGLPANLAAMPFISFIVMPAGLLAMLLMPFGLDYWPLKVMGLGLDAVIAVAREVASWGGEGSFGRLHPLFFPLSVAGFLFLTLLATRLRLVGLALIVLAVAIAAFAPAKAPPALLVAETGAMAALVREDVLATNRERPADFIFAQWQRALKRGGHAKPAILGTDDWKPAEGQSPWRRRLSAEEEDAARLTMRAAVDEAEPGRFSCLKKAWCAARLENGVTIVVLENAAFTGAACDSAGIVVTAARLSFERCRSGALLFTGETLRRSGAVEIRFTGENPARPVVTAALHGAGRPWNRHRLYDWRSGSFLDADDGFADDPEGDSGDFGEDVAEREALSGAAPPVAGEAQAQNRGARTGSGPQRRRNRHRRCGCRWHGASRKFRHVRSAARWRASRPGRIGRGPALDQ